MDQGICTLHDPKNQFQSHTHNIKDRYIKKIKLLIHTQKRHRNNTETIITNIERS